MKIVTVVGARPQFIKAAVVSEILRKKHTEVLIHTGQHYDYNMSAQFFKELDIPDPDYNLGISGGTHAQMTGRMMIATEQILQKYIGGGGRSVTCLWRYKFHISSGIVSGEVTYSNLPCGGRSTYL